MTRRPALVLGMPLLAASLALSGCTGASAGSSDGAAESSDAAATRTQVAEQLLRITEPHEATGMTLLEGPVFGPDGELFVVDVTAPPGEPKVWRIDVEDETAEAVFTDDTGAYTSAQLGPNDGRLYLTDFIGGSIVSIALDGTDPQTFYSGPVDGVPMNPDDVSFNAEGDLFVTDSAGYLDPYWEASGRLIRIDGETAEATVLASELASPNGIAFSPEYDSLWVSLNTGNQIDHIGLSDDGTVIETASPAFHLDGGVSQVDSLATDADGNVYAGFHNRAAIVVYAPNGELLQTISVPEGDGVSSATNLAIAPGTTTGYMTVSGSAGGFVYTFDALAEGTRQSNGG